jgi:DNA-binding SARP family transcriptional activator/tetratricopeptide (TPR) repeat protein
MIRLRVLGGVDLRDNGGRDLNAILAQPKRLALLTYLALARPTGFHRREVLLSIFWPESDHGTARNALRQALHHLRHALGDGVIVSRGENDVGVDHAVLWSDAAAFASSLDSGDTDGALTLYRGDLMPGTLIGDAPEFNRWLDEEREHLCQRVKGALESGASEAEKRGDHGSAVRARRRSSTLEPLSARVALSLMHALANAGDRAAAIQHATVFARALRDELGLEADYGVTSFAAELRGDARSLRVDVVRDANPSYATDSVTVGHAGAPRVVVLPFTVHGGPAYQYLEQGMVDLLSRSLDGGGNLRVVDPYAVIGLTNRSASGPADPELGRQVAQRFGAGLFVLGSIVGAEGRLQMFVTLYDVDQGRLVSAEARVGGEAELFEIVEDVTRQLLIGRLAPTERLARLAATMTPSIAALKAYLLGESHFRSGCFGLAREAFERAVASDPLFALAWYRLGLALSRQYVHDLAASSIERAVALSDRMEEGDRALLEAFLAFVQGRADEAETRCRAILAAQPHNVEAWLRLAEVMLIFNPMRGRTSAEIRLPLARVLELDPENGPARISSAYVAMKEGALDEYSSHVRKWDEKSELSIFPRAMHALSVGTATEADAMVDELAHSSDAVVNEAARYIARLTHNIPGASRIARLLVDSSRPPDTIAHGHIVMAQLAAAGGRHREAFENLDHASRLDPFESRAHRALLAVLPFLPVARGDIDALRSTTISLDMGPNPAPPGPFTAIHQGLQEALGLYVLGHLHARAEEFDTALGAADRLAGVQAPAWASGVPDGWARGVRAHVAWREGRPAHALTLLEGASFEVSLAQRLSLSPFVCQNFERYLLAYLLELLGRDEEALRWYECVSADVIHEVVFLAPSYLRRATIHDRRGDYPQAREFYQRFIALWRDGEPEEAAVVADAQRRLVRLGGRGVR